MTTLEVVDFKGLAESTGKDPVQEQALPRVELSETIDRFAEHLRRQRMDSGSAASDQPLFTWQGGCEGIPS